MSYIVAIEGLNNLEDLKDLPQKIVRASIATVNRATDRARTLASRQIREQVNYPARYLSASGTGLQIVRKATAGDPQAIIRARFEATSLARFTTQRSPKQSRKRGGVDVEVKPGERKFIPNAFIIQWKAGSLGLAVRLKEGESLRNKKYKMKLWNNLAILYGPSVDQVFQSVREDISPEIAQWMDVEFNRLLGVNL